MLEDETDAKRRAEKQTQNSWSQERVETLLEAKWDMMAELKIWKRFDYDAIIMLWGSIINNNIIMMIMIIMMMLLMIIII